MIAPKQCWPKGPWHEEPDYVQWIDERTHLDCIAYRHPAMGHWCGYIGVPAGHPLYEEQLEHIDRSVDVHGGVTFAGPAAGEATTQLPTARLWWIGFDCAHADDLPPALLVRFPGNHRWGEYRTLEYVRNELSCLAEQLVELQRLAERDR